MSHPLRVLLVEDCPDDAVLVQREVVRAGLVATFDRVDTPEAMREALGREAWDVILCDYALPQFSAPAALALARATGRDLPFIVVSGQIGEDRAVAMMKAGAHDYVMKDALKRLGPVIRRELQEAQTRREHRRAQEALRHERYLLTSLLASTPDYISFKDAQGRFLRINRALAAHFGLDDPAEAAGKADADFFGPQYARQARADDEEILRTGQAIVDKEERQNWPDRRDTWVSTTRVPLYSPQGEIVGTIGISRDITDRKRAEQALREAEASYRELAESISDVFFAMDEFLTYTYWNRAAEALTGIPAGDAVGKSFYDLFPEAADSVAEEAYQEVLRTGRPRSFVTEHHLGRQDQFFEVSVYPFRNGVSVFARDITDRERAEASLADSEKRYRQLVENLNDGIWVIDAAARTTFVNRRMAEMLGYTVQEMLGKHLLMFVDDANMALCRERLARRRMGIAEQYDFEFLRKDGSRVYVAIHTSPLTDADGAYAGAIAAVMDITDRKHLEAEFRQAQKMEAIGQLAGGIAHDFRNQLTVIQGYAEMLLRRSLVAPRAAEAVDEILKAVERSAVLTRDLLAFSRKQVLHPRAVDLNKALGELGKPLARIIGEDVRVRIGGAEGLDSVRIDPGMFQQALMNLAVNAREAMPRGGQLTIETAGVVLDAPFVEQHVGASPGPHVMVAVSDTGFGMDEETRRRAFEPFFTTKPVGRGTGLGLSMVYGFVKQSRGYVTVESRPGHGSTFRMYFPVTPASDDRHGPAEDSPDLAHGSATVLIVEDEKSIRRILTETLRECGYTALEAANAREALPLGSHYNGSIDLLITDVVMPGMNGVDLADQIRSVRPGIRVLYISGHPETTLADHGLTGDCASLLEKPFTSRAAMDAVRRVLGKADGKASGAPPGHCAAGPAGPKASD